MKTSAENTNQRSTRSVLQSPGSGMAVVLHIEWGLLSMRYVGFLILIILNAVGFGADYLPELRKTTVLLILHIGYTHWVLHTERYFIFTTKLNFFVHLASLSVLIGLTGGPNSPIALSYILFIIGYHAYVPYHPRTLIVAVCCCVAYAFTVLFSWFLGGIHSPYPPIGAQMGIIVIAGWLMAQLGQMLEAVENQAHRQSRELATSEATLRAILNSTANPIVVYSEDEFITDVNDRACTFLGVPREKLIGRRFRSFIFDDGSLPTKIANLRARGEYRGEVLVVNEAGEESNVEWLVRSFMRDDKRYYVSMLHDVTEQKQVEEASRLAQAQLERVNLELQHVNELRTSFFATVSRRLRSPLSAVLGYIDMLLNSEFGELQGDQRRVLQNSRTNMSRVFSLLDETIEVAGTEPQSAPVSESAKDR